jgi:hypothetical protein
MVLLVFLDELPNIPSHIEATAFAFVEAVDVCSCAYIGLDRIAGREVRPPWIQQIFLRPCDEFPHVLRRYQSQMPVIEKAIETAALMLGSDRSRGYCLEMIVRTSWRGPIWAMEIRRRCCSR